MLAPTGPLDPFGPLEHFGPYLSLLFRSFKFLVISNLFCFGNLLIL